MFLIQALDRISPIGLESFPRDSYEIASEIVHPDAILVRSHSMHDMKLPVSLRAIVRAGIGVNNIPVETCSERGIVVFNTPGTNANSVKELVLAGLFLSSRKIVQGINWAKSLGKSGSDAPTLIEKGKSEFSGPEIWGKRLGVIGLGVIGVMVANDAAALGMEVTGYDPFISVESAWELSRNIKRAKGFEQLLAHSDYITLHVPLTEETKGMINREKFSYMKRGIRLLNFSRNDLVQNHDLKEAIDKGIVSVYVTDFPDADLLNTKNVIAIPHLGASTPEAEENCALMAVRQTRNFLEEGNIKNSVNFPDCQLFRTGRKRITVANKNVPRMVGQITTILAQAGINIADMLNKSKENVAYNIIDIDGDINEELLDKIRNIEGVTMAHLIP